LGISTTGEYTGMINLPKKTELNTLVLEEMIAYGQRVSNFTIEAFDGTEYQTVFTGTTIGRKKIASFKKQETDRLRLTIDHAKAAPVLRNISGYLISSL
jgi:alpha-L-fucosidase